MFTSTQVHKYTQYTVHTQVHTVERLLERGAQSLSVEVYNQGKAGKGRRGSNKTPLKCPGDLGKAFPWKENWKGTSLTKLLVVFACKYTSFLCF